MPGAPNRPPATPASASPTPPGEEAGRAVLRRLAPMRVALALDQWKGAPSPELVLPFERAEASFSQGDWAGAQGYLDQLSVRFAEPRWPTLPVPFRELRVTIPAPQPPQWDPEHGLPPAEKETRRLQREAERQLALARASVAWMRGKGLGADDLDPIVAEAEAAFRANGPVGEVWAALDRLWAAVRGRVAAPRAAGARPPAPAADSA